MIEHATRINPFPGDDVPDPKRVLPGRMSVETLKERLGEDYTLMQVLGGGESGIVAQVYDKHAEKERAIKVLAPTDLVQQQLFHRNKTLLAAAEDECDTYFNLKHVMSRRLKVVNGHPLIVMDLAKHDLDEHIRSWERMRHPSPHYHDLSQDEVWKYIRQMATGVSEVHKKNGAAHGDIKLDNFLVDNFHEVQLGDFGTGTLVKALHTGPRDNMGHPNIRAPEGYVVGSEPTFQSDVYSLGSCLYKMLTGSYVLEEEMKTQRPEEAMFTLKADPSLLEKKIRQTPRAFHGLLRSSLALRPEDRAANATEWLSQLEKAYERRTGLLEAWDRTKRFSPFAIFSAMFIWSALQLSYLSVSHDGYELRPKHVFAPYTTVVSYEDMERPTTVLKTKTLLAEYAKHFSSDPLLSRLVTAYRTADTEMCGPHSPVKAYTQDQHAVFMRSPYRDAASSYDNITLIVGANMEKALAQSTGADGVVDLEDVFARCRFGDKLVMQAMKASQSTEYAHYRRAKVHGSFVLDQDQVAFVDKCIAYGARLHQQGF